MGGPTKKQDAKRKQATPPVKDPNAKQAGATGNSHTDKSQAGDGPAGNSGGGLSALHDFGQLPINGRGSGGSSDPIHAPLIEKYRRENGYPPGGKNEAGEPIGPSDAEIKYGDIARTGGGKMATADAPLTSASDSPASIDNSAVDNSAIASMNVDKTGKVQGFKLDAFSKLVFDALMQSNRAYIVAHGYFPMGDTEFDPRVPEQQVADALIQWIGKSKIPDIDHRITTDYGNGKPIGPQSGGRVELQVFYMDHPSFSNEKDLPEPKDPLPGKKKDDGPGPEAEASIVVNPHTTKKLAPNEHRLDQETQLQVTYDPSDGPVQEVQVTVHVGANGLSQIEADISAIKKEIPLTILRKIGMGDSKVTITAGINFSDDIARDQQGRFTQAFSASFKAAIELEPVINGVTLPAPQLSASIGPDGKPQWQMQWTIAKFK